MIKSVSKIALMTALIAGTAGHALALDVNASGGVSAGTTVQTDMNKTKAGVNAGAGADVAANSSSSSTENFGQVISDIQTNVAANVDLNTITDADKIEIIDVATLKGNASANSQALTNALDKNAEAMTELHADVEANTTLKTKLEEEGFEVDDVVALQTEADGMLKVYVWDQA